MEQQEGASRFRRPKSTRGRFSRRFRYASFDKVKSLDVEIEDMDDVTLNYWLSKFVMEVAKESGERYPPKTVYGIIASLKRHLADINGSEALNPLDISDKRYMTCTKQVQGSKIDKKSHGINLQFCMITGTQTDYEETNHMDDEMEDNSEPDNVWNNVEPDMDDEMEDDPVLNNVEPDYTLEELEEEYEIVQKDEIEDDQNLNPRYYACG
ncbi:hypothetical protein QZH41_010325 [Actinostola sp. cb2023]|nr:hypothetical protein QZH41_010325 [Actinostola sp. cb2023]